MRKSNLRVFLSMKKMEFNTTTSKKRMTRYIWNLQKKKMLHTLIFLNGERKIFNNKSPKNLNKWNYSSFQRQKSWISLDWDKLNLHLIEQFRSKLIYLNQKKDVCSRMVMKVSLSKKTFWIWKI